MKCNICPRLCNIDRDSGVGYCKSTNTSKVSLVYIHEWEEPFISGENGSGTVFFTNCNLSCIYCQNYKISQENFGQEVSVERLSEIFLELQQKNVHNINLVSPTHYLYQVRDAIIIAKQNGLNIPIVYNSNGYENVEALKSLEGLINVYLPDLKYYDNILAERYSNVKDYFKYATNAILEMFRQVGSPEFDENGIIKSGLVIRHLILPNQVENTKHILKWIKENLPDEVFVSLMGQYTPMYKALDDRNMNRRIYKREYDEIIDYFFEIGLSNGYVQELSSAQKIYTPTFDLTGVIKV
jgi:putative pyruvate formate lyase activating enzyme